MLTRRSFFSLMVSPLVAAFLWSARTAGVWIEQIGTRRPPSPLDRYRWRIRIHEDVLQHPTRPLHLKINYDNWTCSIKLQETPEWPV
jgi:hypothetical protein